MHEIPISVNIKHAWYIESYLRWNEGGKTDPISLSILNFKDGRAKEINEWCIKAKDELKKTGVNFEVIVRALGHGELNADRSGNKPLDILGRYLEREMPSRYMPDIIRKGHPNEPFHKKGSLKERREALSGNYSVIYNPIIDKSNILIIDDIITSGTTLTVMSNTMKMIYPKSTIYAFALGKTADRNEYL